MLLAEAPFFIPNNLQVNACVFMTIISEGC